MLEQAKRKKKNICGDVVPELRLTTALHVIKHHVCLSTNRGQQRHIKPKRTPLFFFFFFKLLFKVKGCCYLTAVVSLDFCCFLKIEISYS